MFFVRSSKVHVDCFTYIGVIHSEYPIERASKYIPSEWKALASSYKERAFPNVQESKMELDTSTIKKCTGFTNLFSTGFILPSWSDFDLEVIEDGRFLWHSPSPIMQMHTHDRRQLGSWELYSGYSHIKIISPWSFTEKTGVKFAWNRCDWHNSQRAADVHVISGVVDYKYQHSTNVNMFVKKPSITKFLAGDPLVHIIPLSEKEVVIHNHLISEKEHQSRFGYVTSNVNGYKKSKNKQVEKEKGKCPFGFGR
jgi:hypothetical protein